MLQRETLEDWLNALAAIGVEMEPVGAHNFNGPCPLCGGKDRFHLSQGDERVLVGCRRCIDGKPKEVSRKRYGMLTKHLFPPGRRRQHSTPAPVQAPARPRGQASDAVQRARRIWAATAPVDRTPGADYLVRVRWCWPPPELGFALPAEVRWLSRGSIGWPRLPSGASGALVFALRVGNGELQAVHLEAIDTRGERIDWESPKGEPYPRKTFGRLTGAYFRLPARTALKVQSQPRQASQVTIVEGVEDALAEYWHSPSTDILGAASTVAGIETLEVKDYPIVRLIPDPDDAGRDAAETARNRLLEEGLAPSQVRVSWYQDGDPAEHWKRMLTASAENTDPARSWLRHLRTHESALDLDDVERWLEE